MKKLSCLFHEGALALLVNLTVFDEKAVLEESGGALSTAVLGFEGPGDGQVARLEVQKE